MKIQSVLASTLLAAIIVAGLQARASAESNETECLAPEGFCPGDRKDRWQDAESNDVNQDEGGDLVVGPPAVIIVPGGIPFGAAPACLGKPLPCP